MYFLCPTEISQLGHRFSVVRIGTYSGVDGDDAIVGFVR